MINSWFKRGTLRFNFDKTISPKVRMGLSSQFAFSNAKSGIGQYEWGGGRRGHVRRLAIQSCDPRQGQHRRLYVCERAQPLCRPCRQPCRLCLETTNKTNNFRALINTFLEYEIIKGSAI